MNRDLSIGFKINDENSIYEIIKAINLVVDKKGQAIIAIDGRCGSGKTTLAGILADDLDVVAIHMDDFYLPKELRTDERRSQPGGNVHYERFNEEVAERIRKKQDITYRIFSCSTMDYVETVNVRSPKVIIIEGSYSLYPLFDDIYDIKIFCDIDKETQKNRIIKRDGIEKYEDFKTKWIPMEEKYFKMFSVKEKCDIKMEYGMKRADIV